jgi:hypothetical protein
MKKQIFFIALLFFAFDAIGQTPVTTRRLNTDSIVERVLNNGIQEIGERFFHDSIYMENVPASVGPQFIMSYDSATGLVTKTLASEFAGDTTYPDSSVLFVGSDGRPTTDSNRFYFTRSTINPILNIGTGFSAPSGMTRFTYHAHGGATNGFSAFSAGTANSSSLSVLYKSRGSVLAPASVIAGDLIGRLRFSGYNGTTFVTAFELRGYARETFSTSQNTYLSFSVKNTLSADVFPLMVHSLGITINPANATDTDTIFSLKVNGTAAITQTPASTNGTDSILVKASTGQVSAMPFTQGVYLPVDSAGSNIDGVTPDTAFYSRVGNVVTVSGVVEIDPTTTLTPTFFYMNLPIFQSTTSTNRAGGTFAAYIVNESGAIVTDGTTPTSVLFQFNPTATGANIFSYTYSYRIQ